ncbi:cobalt-precorrin-5B (C(1))-methyltransferase [Acetobacter orleanensis]|uniref:cobalt-precorrin-5B (C(1))-methyltransferase n=1 Tax=Acetobacter orleanensis TaxID=104099 RepID=UPI001AE01CFF|nr:cobalt-precorrin-5B (C(1))-methyltransferase [Acetobacter orleanensis]
MTQISPTGLLSTPQFTPYPQELACRSQRGVGIATRPSLPMRKSPSPLTTGQTGRTHAQQRLGLMGGLSELGKSCFVIPFFCAAWINSIHRRVDVDHAEGLTHLAASTGNVSAKAV